MDAPRGVKCLKRLLKLDVKSTQGTSEETTQELEMPLHLSP